MPEVICNASPLLYLHRLGALEWLHSLFSEVWVPAPVIDELREGLRLGYDVPRPEGIEWIKVVESKPAPAEWLVFDLGSGELAVLTLALEHRDRVVLLDDGLARRIGQAAGLTVWGTLRILLQAKERGLTSSVAPLLEALAEAGMWMSEEIRQRVLVLAREDLGRV